jgi:hypothetical protein
MPDTLSTPVSVVSKNDLTTTQEARRTVRTGAEGILGIATWMLLVTVIVFLTWEVSMPHEFSH